MILVQFSPADRLYLSHGEAARLAEQIRQALVCRTAAQADELVVVADVELNPAEAWQLVEKLENSGIGPKQDWLTEGF